MVPIITAAFARSHVRKCRRTPPGMETDSSPSQEWDAEIAMMFGEG
jgi:hypothetical protein